METFSVLLVPCAGNSPVTGEFPAQKPMTRSFDVSFDPRPNKRLSKQSRGCWFKTPSRSLWRHCNASFTLLVACVMPVRHGCAWSILSIFVRIVLRHWNDRYTSMSLGLPCGIWVNITMTSQWARWRLKSPASPLFAQVLVQSQIKGNIKAPRDWPLSGEFTAPVNSPHKGSVTRKMCPFDVILTWTILISVWRWIICP